VAPDYHKTVSKNVRNYIISLQKKRSREEHRVFVIEGDKLIREFLASDFSVVSLIAKPEFISSLQPELLEKAGEVIPVRYEELKKISSMVTPHNAIAVIRMPDIKFSTARIFRSLSLALDTIQDPGNLGTIIRAAAWFGIRNIICTENCVDVYNPKVIQATMGAFINVNVFYTDLVVSLKKARENNIPVYGAMLEGTEIYGQQPDKRGIVLLGNESKGISGNLLSFVSHRIVIPRIKGQITGIESLNVGMAASIIMYEFTRKKN